MPWGIGLKVNAKALLWSVGGRRYIYQNRNILRSRIVESESERHSLEVFNSTYVGGLSCDPGSPLHTGSDNTMSI